MERVERREKVPEILRVQGRRRCWRRREMREGRKCIICKQ